MPTRTAPPATLDVVLERVTYANQETGYDVGKPVGRAGRCLLECSLIRRAQQASGWEHAAEDARGSFARWPSRPHAPPLGRALPVARGVAKMLRSADP